VTPGEEPAAVATELMRTLPGHAYLTTDSFTREAEAIFFREWFVVGREGSIPEPGDYLHVEVAGESVLVVRARDRELRAFHNVCRHRGSRLVMDDPPTGGDGGRPHGRFKGAIRCPYHAWTYGLDGRLRAAPFLTESDGLRGGALGLHQVAVDTWGGFIFLNVSRSAVADDRTLARQVAGPALRLRNYPLADLRTARRIAYDVAANWKVIVENYNECYHCGPVHDVHLHGHDEPRSVPGSVGAGEGQTQGRVDVPEPDAEPFSGRRHRVHAVAARRR
jgi:Rieske 2Fe-2S family protein